jgi:hypothetical protein
MHALTVAFQHCLAKGVDVIGQDHIGGLPDDIRNSLVFVQVTRVAYRAGQSSLPHEFQGGSRTGIQIKKYTRALILSAASAGKT